MIVDVELGDRHPVGHFVGYFLERGADHLARTAPFGPEIDQYWFISLQNVGLKAVVRNRRGRHDSDISLGWNQR